MPRRCSIVVGQGGIVNTLPVEYALRQAHFSTSPLGTQGVVWKQVHVWRPNSLVLKRVGKILVEGGARVNGKGDNTHRRRVAGVKRAPQLSPLRLQ